MLLHPSLMLLTYGPVLTLFDVTVKATVLLALAAIIAILSRHASASFRHIVWALSLASVFVLPLLAWNMPHWRVPITARPTHIQPAAALPPPLAETAQAQPKPTNLSQPSHQPNAAHAGALIPADTTPDALQPPVRAHIPSPRSAVSPVLQVPWIAWVLLAWMCGAIFVLTRLVQGLMTVWRIPRDSLPVTVGLAAEAAAAASTIMGVSRTIALRQATSPGRVTVPLTYGLLRPVLVLPTEALHWPEERLRAALLHEMAHVRRHDWALQIMGHFVCTIYWFHPLVWIAAKRMRAEAEAACDDLVLGAGVPATDYARHLLDVALSARQSRRISGGAVAMAQSPKVEGRLRAVLAQGLSRRPISMRMATNLVVTALLVTIPLAAMRLAVHAQPVPAADRLQLGGDFILRYAMTVTDLETTQGRLREYQQLRAKYDGLLKKDPYYQPVPAEYYGPFSYFQEHQPRTRHLIQTISARNGQLLWQSTEKGETFALLYDGHSTHSYGDGHAGSVEPIFEFGMMSDCPLPAVGLPYAPLFKAVTVTSTAGADQTWAGQCLVLDAEGARNAMLYLPGTIRAVKDGGIWKVLSAESFEQRLDFLEHQRFQGLWIASRFRLTQYDISALPPQGQITTLQQAEDWMRARRTPTSVCEYRLLSSSSTPLDESTLGKRSASTAAPAVQSPPLDDLDVQEALHLRFHLQDWARSHEALLRRMGDTSPSDFSAASAVDQSLRALPFPLWQGGGIVWDGDPRTGHDGQKPLFTAEGFRQGNGMAQDFVIARSRDAGASHVFLWASGRITRVTALGTGRTEIQQEIVPAFFASNGTRNMAGDALEEDYTGQLSLPLTPVYGFRRYVSPPLPDGTRYTFLYPSYFTTITPHALDASNQFGTVLLDCVGSLPVAWAASRSEVPISYYQHGNGGGSWRAPHEEMISVVVGRAGKVAFPGSTSTLRTERRWAGLNGNHHAFSVTDRRTDDRFTLIHEDRYIPPIFKQTDPVISSSFRILPPGVAAP